MGLAVRATGRAAFSLGSAWQNSPQCLLGVSPDPLSWTLSQAQATTRCLPASRPLPINSRVGSTLRHRLPGAVPQRACVPARSFREVTQTETEQDRIKTTPNSELESFCASTLKHCWPDEACFMITSLYAALWTFLCFSRPLPAPFKL